jgi:hypothetical protein
MLAPKHDADRGHEYEAEQVAKDELLRLDKKRLHFQILSTLSL